MLLGRTYQTVNRQLVDMVAEHRRTSERVFPACLIRGSKAQKENLGWLVLGWDDRTAPAVLVVEHLCSSSLQYLGPSSLSALCPCRRKVFADGVFRASSTPEQAARARAILDGLTQLDPTRMTAGQRASWEAGVSG